MSSGDGVAWLRFYNLSAEIKLVAQIAFSPKILWSYAMPHEQHGYEENNLADIWRSAQRRRTADIYSWFTHFFERHRQLKSSDPRPQFPQRRATALAWKLLNAIRAVRRTVH